MFESVYIDINGSGNLDFGDRVWGNNPNDLGALCFNNFNTDQTFDWDAVAAGVFGGSTFYTGPTQLFRGATNSELELMNNAIIVDGGGYDSINMDDDVYDRIKL